VRGSSGLAGFAVGGFAPVRIEEFHETLRGLLGEELWRKWGTEQCASNFAVANSPDPVVLPFPKYANFGPTLETAQSSFVHFIGTYRFLGDRFATQGREVIRELQAA
jgi:hypothetical protein